MTIIELPTPAPVTTTHRLADRFDAHELDAFRTMAASVRGDLALDLSGLRFIDSAALNLLVETRAALLDRGHELWIEEPSIAARITLELAGLDEAFPLMGSMHEAAA
jgi:anti-anti-sigma factor